MMMVMRMTMVMMMMMMMMMSDIKRYDNRNNGDVMRAAPGMLVGLLLHLLRRHLSDLEQR